MMKIAVEGCAHGELDKIYESIQVLEKENNIKVDLLIICGDFQSVRNPADLECMAVPPKYRLMNTFYKYYSGEKVAPVLTLFIGGNHEASNYLSELSYGGWVCPKIYYMGCAGVVNVGGIRIAGLSGIFKGRDYLKGHFECPPYDESSKKSIYHVRNLEVFRLKQIQNPVDICVSHDWPRGIYHHGNKQEILRWKPFFREEMESNKLGSQAAEELLEKLKPSYWFSAHLHCKFVAVVRHNNPSRPITKFLALDKCLPRRNFLQILDIGSKNESIQIEYDPEWLCILRNTNHLLNTTKRNSYMPGVGGNEKWNFSSSVEEMKCIKELFKNDLRVPNNFTVTAPTYNPSHRNSEGTSLKIYLNPQTQAFCRILNITDPLEAVAKVSRDSVSISDFSCSDTDKSYNSFSSFIVDSSRCSEESSVNGSISPKSEPDLTNTDDKMVVTENDPEEGEFFIDKLGTHKDDSSLFFIDKVGSCPDAKPSNGAVIKKNSIQEQCLNSEFFIDTSPSQEEHLKSDYMRMPKSHSPLNAFVSNNIKSDSSHQDYLNSDKVSGCKRKSPDFTPKHSSYLQNPFCSTPIADNKSSLKFPELKQSSILDNPIENEGSAPVAKKFKRRNWSLYQPECDMSM